MSDIDRIRREVSLPATVQSFGVAMADRGAGEWEGLCPFHNEKSPSFQIFPGSSDGINRFHCKGCGEGGDVIDFVEKIQGVSTKEAIDILLGHAGRGVNIAPAVLPARDIYAGIEARKPVTELATNKKLVLYNPKREQNGNITPSLVHPYRQIDGTLIGYVLRHDLPDGGKETPMVQWADVSGRGECWCRLPFSKPRPLYGLERLGSSKQVILVEGEKCADALNSKTSRVFMSWPGGTYGARHVDWSPLTGRDVLIWPDYDDPGWGAKSTIKAALDGIAKKTRLVDIGKGLRRERDHF